MNNPTIISKSSFFDEKRPNKYNYLKRRIYPYKPYHGYIKKRYGERGDGSYVFLENLFTESKFVYSYGIGSESEGISFDKQAADLGKKVYMYDGSVSEAPLEHDNFIFKSEFLYKNVIKKHIFENDHLMEDDMVLKMDIEGFEYEVISTDISIISRHFNQLCIEIHSLIEEIPHGWILDEPLLSIKTNKDAKRDFFDKILLYYNIVHIHANNHAPRHLDFPDSLEITFLRKDYPVTGKDKSVFPIDGLDFANYNRREDYVLDWWT